MLPYQLVGKSVYWIPRCLVTNKKIWNSTQKLKDRWLQICLSEKNTTRQCFPKYHEDNSFSSIIIQQGSIYFWKFSTNDNSFHSTNRHFSYCVAQQNWTALCELHWHFTLTIKDFYNLNCYYKSQLGFFLPQFLYAFKWIFSATLCIYLPFHITYCK